MKYITPTRRIPTLAIYWLPILLLCFVELTSTPAMHAQVIVPNLDWGRLQSWDGQLSVDFPTSLSVIRNKEGASVPQERGGSQWREMRILNSYSTGTLLSVEIYQESKSELDRLFDSDSRPLDIKGITADRKIETGKKNGVAIRQVTQTTPDSYMVRQYLSSSTHIYVLTAATRGGESPAMKRFLESVIFDPRAKAISPSNGFNIDSLATSPLEIVQNSKHGSSNKSEPIKFLTRSAGSELILLAKHRPSYTDQARQGNIQGVIRINATVGVNGAISKLQILSPLGGGLVRQAIFAALRAKFLPDEQAGVAKVSEAVLEYKFAIY